MTDFLDLHLLSMKPPRFLFLKTFNHCWVLIDVYKAFNESRLALFIYGGNFNLYKFEAFGFLLSAIWWTINSIGVNPQILDCGGREILL